MSFLHFVKIDHFLNKINSLNLCKNPVLSIKIYLSLTYPQILLISVLKIVISDTGKTHKTNKDILLLFLFFIKIEIGHCLCLYWCFY